jgi:protein-L-isoaspartate(D-aspartate) O-methyltransferase
MTDRAEDRERMVERQIAARGIRDEAILTAMRTVPREDFVPPERAAEAYDDDPVAIGAGQTISQPYIVAAMIDAARVAGSDRVLEVGAGSGYAAAVLSRIARSVHAIERLPALGQAAARRIERLGYRNCRIHVGDGTLGLPEEAPFDVIIVSAGGPDIPEALKHQLAPGGRLVMPVGREAHDQMLVRLVRRDGDRFEREDLEPVRFVPLIGKEGWPE